MDTIKNVCVLYPYSHVYEYEYNKARVDGSKSFYIVYSKPEFFDTHEHSSTSSVIVDSSCDALLGFTARSMQGWDKDGIILLEHHWYFGTGHTYTTSTPDITHEFPSGYRGASSIIVMKGYWSLYKDKNYNGIKISLNGKSEFGPGTHLYSLFYYTNCRTGSILRNQACAWFKNLCMDFLELVYKIIYSHHHNK